MYRNIIVGLCFSQFVKAKVSIEIMKLLKDNNIKVLK